MTPTPLKELDYLEAWAVFAVGSTVGGFIAGAVVGGILGAVLGASGMPEATVKPVCGIGGLLAGLPVSCLMFRECAARMPVTKVHAVPPPAEEAQPA